MSNSSIAHRIACSWIFLDKKFFIVALRMWYTSTMLCSLLSQGKIESAGFALDTFRPDFPVMGFDNRPADGQSETGAFGLGDTGRRNRGKLIEYGFEIFLSNTNSPIFDRHRYVGGVFFNIYFYFGIGSGKLDGIFNQIDQDLLNPFKIHFHQDITGRFKIMDIFLSIDNGLMISKTSSINTLKFT